MKFKIGDRVRVKKKNGLSRKFNGEIGTIIKKDIDVLVDFDKRIKLRTEFRHDYWFSIDDLELAYNKLCSCRICKAYLKPVKRHRKA